MLFSERERFFFEKFVFKVPLILIFYISCLLEKKYIYLNAYLFDISMICKTYKKIENVIYLTNLKINIKQQCLAFALMHLL